MIEKKKILIFIDWYLPGFRAGGPVTSCAGLVEHLAGEFDFFIVCRDTDYTRAIPYSEITPNCWVNRGDGVHVYYVSKDQLRVTTLRSIYSQINPDFIYLNSLFSFWFTLVPLWLLRGRQAKVILAARGMLAPSALAIKRFKKTIFLLNARLFGLFNKVVFQASSASEREDIRVVFSNNEIQIAPNLPRKKEQLIAMAQSAPLDGLRLVNIARIAPEKNLLGALTILKAIRAKVNFEFYGPVYNQSYWSKCQAEIASLPANITVKYHGAIEPQDIPAVLSQHHFLFMPTRGENFGHIIYESLNCGTPVIISDRTPWKDLKNQGAGWDIPLENQHQFIEAIESCATMSAKEYEQLRATARQTALEFMNKSDAVVLNKALFL